MGISMRLYHTGNKYDNHICHYKKVVREKAEFVLCEVKVQNWIIHTTK